MSVLASPQRFAFGDSLNVTIRGAGGKNKGNKDKSNAENVRPPVKGASRLPRGDP